jgi:TolB-like protein/Tfp pilus assembly protein PilF
MRDRQRVRFGEFEVDFHAGELSRCGVKIKLQRQPLQVLQLLLEQSGKLVTREELRQKIWPSDTFVDFEQGLYNAVRRLRDALEDSADKPRFIETLARRGYRFIGTVETRPRKIESLAVLPLEDLSGAPEQEYFAEGLTEALITTLAKIGDLRVVSRTSAMRYKGVRKPLQEIAQELDVDVVVEGTVLRAEQRVRITAQLIHAATETHLWAETYDRELRDVLSLQSEVAQAIARQIQIKLTPQEQAHFEQIQVVDPEAYEAYLKGRYHWNRRSGKGLQYAVQYFQQAIAKDSAYVAAYAGLADCLSLLGFWGFVHPDEGAGRAKQLALKAIEMNRGLAEAHTSLAWATIIYDFDFRTAEREYERAIELDPRYATAHQWFGISLILMGRFDEGFTELKRAIRLDPLSIIINATLGMGYWLARRYDEQIEQFEKTLELDPDFALAHAVLGYAYLYKCMHEQGIAEVRKGLELSQGAPTFLAWLAEAYAAGGYFDEAQEIMRELEQTSTQRYVMRYQIARICAALGKKEEALQWLEIGYRERDPWTVALKVEPRFDDLRSDPRFQDLMVRMNFPA